MPNANIDNILAGLSSNQAGSAWKAFLLGYNTVIMQVVDQYEGDNSRADDCFLFVCEKLSDDGFRRLLRFDRDRKVQFNTWLKLVVSRLCVDWHRKEYGRQRPYRAIAKLSELDQMLYHYKVERGMNRTACLQALQLSYPDLTPQQLAESNGRLHNALSSRQRWQMSMRRRQAGSAVIIDAYNESSKEAGLTEPDPGPESVAQLLQTREALVRAMTQLSNEQQLLLRLRYQEDLPLKDVARLSGLDDLHKARRRLKTALKTLAELLASEKRV